ncbi:MAG: pyridoxamine 5'-phosphate oxidase [Gammaproteobacteria bacterium]|nr:pyridoxamine 5'-phosphate oxidase [Gammaproteobacteria bacterium]
MADPLRESDLDPNPVEQFTRWYEEARKVAVGDDTAMTLATATPEGQPSARIVLLKEYDDKGFVWFTNYGSRKSDELGMNAKAALLFWWPNRREQVRIEGEVEKISAIESDGYFASRGRMSQLGAWASVQSRPLESREELEERVKMFERDFEGKEIPRPPHWGGFRLVPHAFEFWRDGEARLHDRFRYEKDEDGNWDITRLNP